MKHLAFYQTVTFLGALVTGQLWLILIAILYLYATHKLLSKKTKQVKTLTCDDGINIESIETPKPNAMPSLILPSKGCIVEVYGSLETGKARIMQPSGAGLGKEYPNFAEATKEIDIVAPFLAVNLPEVKGRKVFRGYSTLVIN